MSFSYSDGRISAVSDDAGRSVSYEYDSVGSLVKFTNADSDSFDYEYNAFSSELVYSGGMKWMLSNESMTLVG